MAAPRFSDPIDAAKHALRGRMRAIRHGLDPRLAGLRLTEHLLRETPPPVGAVVSGFWPFGPEIDLRPLLFTLHLMGHPIALPATPPRGQALTFHRWWPGAPMIAERFGTSRPDGSAIRPDMLLVPLLAFDRAGHRLGYGGGYYDRALAALPAAVAIGCAFAEQEVDVVPIGPYDRALAAIVTDRGLIRVETP